MVNFQNEKKTRTVVYSGVRKAS